ncbi:MAG: alpha/beta hydrolase [Eubacteriales bacterium]|nr:alpha/beta hydrolase [Eubacteriales bacterium]
MKRPIHRRWWFILLEVLLALSLCLAVVLSVSTKLQERAIRFICSGGAASGESAQTDVLTLAADASYHSGYPNGTLDLYAAPSDEPLPLVVYAHGGYYIGGDKSSATEYCKTIAAKGYAVANLNYQLAPDGQYPTQILQVNEALSYLLKNAESFGIDPSRVFIGGDSAGGHLASQMGLYYTNPDFCLKTGGTPALSAEQLRGVILLCGYYNTETVRETHFPMIADSIWVLTGEKNYEGTGVSARMNTVGQITPDYPPVYVTCGDKDPFLSQAGELINALEENGVAVDAYLPISAAEPLQHEYQAVLTSAAGAEAMNRLLAFLSEQSKLS